MNIESKEKISKFISEAPLYKKLDISEIKVLINLLHEITFNFYCEHDEEIKTFELQVYPSGINGDYYNSGSFHYKYNHNIYGYEFITQQYKGLCQYCQLYFIDLFINIYKKKLNDESGKSVSKIYLRKIGQFPPFEITPDKEIQKFLSKEDKSNYKKALINLSQSYGIGAYAYFRRIVENEIQRIIKEVSELDIPGSNEIKELIKSYESNHQMTNLIEGINEYLPVSFKTIGDNPFKLLYSELSKGIHEYSEDECMQRAENINTILTFVLKQLYAEKTEIPRIKESVKKL